MKKLKTLQIVAVLVLCLFAIHALATIYLPVDAKIAIRPFRDIVFFPFILFAYSPTDTYCWLTSLGLFDAGRCIVPTGPGLNMIDGSPRWFELLSVITGIISMIVFYYVITKATLSIKKSLS